MGIFDNAERKVVSHTKPIEKLREIDRYSGSYMSNNTLRNMDNNERVNILHESVEKKEAERKVMYDKSGKYERIIAETQSINSLNQWIANGKTYVFKDILFEIYSKALPLDAYFIREHAEQLKYVVDRTVDENGGLSYLTEAANRTHSNILNRIKKIADKVVNEATTRKLKEGNPADALVFDMTEDEKNKYEDEKNTLDIEKLSDLIQKKVLTVVQDEKAREEKHAQLIEDIENDLKETEGVTDEDSLNEALNNIVINKPLAESSTLFTALMRSSYAEILAENVAITSTDNERNEDKKDFYQDYDVNMDIDDLFDDEDEDEELDIDDLIDDEDNLNTDLSLESTATGINMDVVLAEAVSKYTLLETLYSLKLEEYSYNNIKTLSDRINNRSKK